MGILFVQPWSLAFPFLNCIGGWKRGITWKEVNHSPNTGKDLDAGELVNRQVELCCFIILL